MRRIPATILTGYLGSGKTTLLNSILKKAEGERIAVVVNEYGEVGIDGQLVIDTEEEVIELNNGCICCTVRSDLVSALRGLIDSGRAIDRIIIETSGLADPAPIVQTFVIDEILSKAMALDAIVTVVDVPHLPDQLSQHTAQEQICYADLLVLNKIDLVSKADVQRAESAVRALNPLAKVRRAHVSDLGPDELLDIGAFDLKRILLLEPHLLDEDHHDHEHDDGIVCTALQQDAPLDPQLFNTWLNTLVQDVGKDLLRLKGVLHFKDEPRRFVCHGVHMTLDGRPGHAWQQGETRQSQMVFIGRNLDERALRNGFASASARVDAFAS